MTSVRFTRAACGAAVVSLLAGCASPMDARRADAGPVGSAGVVPSTAATPGSATLPPIVMTSHGGFEAEAETWTIAADGSWSFTRTVRSLPPRTASRHGRLTPSHRHELAALVGDPAVLAQLQTPDQPCTVSDGPSEHLDVGAVHYRAGWCGEYRPIITDLRQRIEEFTTGVAGG